MAFEGITHWQVHDNAGRRKYLTEGERGRFLEAAGRLSPSLQALCHTLAFTGCRVSEALGLFRYQIDPERLTLTMRTLKRRRLVYRVIPVPSDLVAMLLALPSSGNERVWAQHRATAWRAVKRTMDLADIAGPMACCKGLRHGFAMKAAGKNVPPNLIQRWMGHASSVTTAIYLDAVDMEERGFAARIWS